MSNPTATYNARTLYRELLALRVIDYSTHGLVGNRLYISTGDRAYRLEELSDEHLQRIIDKYNRDSNMTGLQIMVLEKERRANVSDQTQTT